MDNLYRADSPPPSPSAQIWKVSAGRHHAIILAPWVGLWVHWMGKYSLPCMGDGCPKSRHLRPARWTGYLPVAEVKSSRNDAGEPVTSYPPAILAIGPELAAEIRLHLGKSYPGPGITFERLGKEKRLHLVGAGEIDQGLPLPPAPDPWSTIYRIWGLIPPCQDDGEVIS